MSIVPSNWYPNEFRVVDDGPTALMLPEPYFLSTVSSE